MISKAQVIYKHGPPGCMKWKNWDLLPLRSEEVLIKHTAIGVNAADTYHRGGIDHPWKVSDFPLVVGFEAVGVVENIGENVTNFKIGDKVAYAIPPLGSYSEMRNYPINNLIHLPHDLDDEVVAASLMKGITAYYLIHKTYHVQKKDFILVHAAAGGTGLILCQWAKHLGAKVIGTVSSIEKAELANKFGCDFPIIRTKEDFVEKVHEITNGKGVSVAYDGIGKLTLRDTMKCIKPLGYCVAYGHVSGVPEPIDIVNELGAMGSLFITRPAVMHYMDDRDRLLSATRAFFEVLRKKIVKPLISSKYKLKDAAVAHEKLESGKTVGSSVLIP